MCPYNLKRNVLGWSGKFPDDPKCPKFGTSIVSTAYGAYLDHADAQNLAKPPFMRICRKFENWRDLRALSGKFLRQKSCYPESFRFLWLCQPVTRSWIFLSTIHRHLSQSRFRWENLLRDNPLFILNPRTAEAFHIKAQLIKSFLRTLKSSHAEIPPFHSHFHKFGSFQHN